MNSIRSFSSRKILFLGILAANLCPAPARAEDSPPFVPRPTKRADTQCSVVAWNITLPKPTLMLVCPPEAVFAPLRVYVKFSWAREEDVPDNYLNIVAPSRTPTKFRTRTNERNEREVLLRLKIYEKGKGKPQAKWVSFNSLVGMALVNER